MKSLPPDGNFTLLESSVPIVSCPLQLTQARGAHRWPSSSSIDAYPGPVARATRWSCRVEGPLSRVLAAGHRMLSARATLRHLANPHSSEAERFGLDGRSRPVDSRHHREGIATLATSSEAASAAR
jgi:hypothetical protein